MTARRSFAHARVEQVGLTLVSDTRQEGSSEQIARRAYEIYLERGGAEGGALEDWLHAERHLRGETGVLPPGEKPPSESSEQR